MDTKLSWVIFMTTIPKQEEYFTKLVTKAKNLFKRSFTSNGYEKESKTKWYFWCL